MGSLVLAFIELGEDSRGENEHRAAAGFAWILRVPVILHGICGC